MSLLQSLSNRKNQTAFTANRGPAPKRLWLALFALTLLAGFAISWPTVSVESRGSVEKASSIKSGDLPSLGAPAIQATGTRADGILPRSSFDLSLAHNSLTGTSFKSESSVEAKLGASGLVEASLSGANLAGASLAPPAPMPAVISDSIALTDPTFVRPSAGAITVCPASGNPTTHYKLYEFNLSGCAIATPVTIDTCASGVGLDTNVFVYRQAGGAPSTAGSPTFFPTSPCTNVVASNNNSAVCGPGSLLSSVTTSMSNGNFVVVVSTNGANQTGNFTLSVTSAGCAVTQVASCNAVVVPSSQTFAAAGGSGMANVTIGPACAWTAISNDPSFINITSGAAGVGNGTVNFTVDPNLGEARVGTMTIAGQTFTVTQDAGAVTLPCIHDALVDSTPTYTRPSAGTPPTCPALGNPTVHYKYYEFDLSGCASGVVTASTCNSGPCSVKPPGTLADTQVYIYRKAGGAGSTPGSPIFDPTSACTNALTGNNNAAACGVGSLLSVATSSFGPGRFGVVVTSNVALDVGTFNLNVSAPGCTVTMVPPCGSVTGTVTPGSQTICPGSSAVINVTVGAGGTAPYTISLNNGGGTMTGAGPSFNFTVTPASTTTYTATGTDATGCAITMSNTATVIVGDTTPPTITCPADSSASANGSCQAAVPDYASSAVATDNCSGPVTKTQSPIAGTLVGLGPHIVTVTAMDSSGNSSSCTTTFTVNDTTPPTVTCPANSSASADANCQAAVPNYAASATASDNCGPVTKTQSPAAGTLVGLGPHTVTVTATDGAGNSSSCTTTFTVNDTTPPMVTCPADSSASADANCQAAVPNYAASATASDNCGPVTKTQSPAAGTLVGLGPHTVTVTATDGAGNSSSCTTTFTVNDTTPPMVTCPVDSSASADANCQAAVPNYAASANATDNCGPVTKTQSPAAGTLVGLGPHTVTVTATDGAGNSSSCTTTFTVNDTTAPVVTCPANSSASADANCQAAVPNYAASATATDNCGPVTKTQSPAAGTLVGLGPHTVTVTATDGAGNSSSCTTTFTVNDTTAPTLTCPANSSASADANCQAAVPNYAASATASDNCGPVTKTQSPAAGTLVGLGPHTVTVTATDGAGNNTSCTTTFTVNDTTPPVVTCPAPSSAAADPGTCKAPVPNYAASATASDNCSPSGSITKTQSPAAGTQVGPGPHTVTVTATDQAGNSSTCTTVFTVTDATGPVITLNGQTPSMWPPNHSYHTFTISDFVTSASDSCDGSVSLSSVYILKVTSDEIENGNGDGNTLNDIVIAGDCKSVQLRSERDGGGDGRVYTITFKVKDSSGNFATATAKVVVPHSQNGDPAVDSGPHYTVNSSCP